jgi:hypothetical protein
MTKNIWIKINSYIKNNIKYDIYEKHNDIIIKRLKMSTNLADSSKLIVIQYTKEVIIGNIQLGYNNLNVIETVKSYVEYLTLNEIINKYDLYNKNVKFINNILDLYND